MTATLDGTAEEDEKMRDSPKALESLDSRLLSFFLFFFLEKLRMSEKENRNELQ